MTGPVVFDRGGWLMPGATLAVNNTGRPEPVGAATHITYNITINVPPGANKAAIGRERRRVCRSGGECDRLQ